MEKANYNYEYVFFKYIYEKLELKKLEEKLLNKGIKIYDSGHANERISKYFSLLNKGNSKYFDAKTNETFLEYFNKELSEILNSDNYDEIIKFVESTYKTYFFSNIKDNYVYYGPANFEYMAPSDSIAIGLNYVKYDNEGSEEDSLDSEVFVVDMLNYIQTDLSKEKNMKLAAISYNEVTLNQPFARL